MGETLADLLNKEVFAARIISRTGRSLDSKKQTGQLPVVREARTTTT
jgi:hypothetical protein